MNKAVEEYRVIFKLKDHVAGGFKPVNPLKVADSLKRVGEGLARILSNGVLLGICVWINLEE